VSDPLVSVVTPTWDRHGVLVDRCIPSVLAQAYCNVEHIVVSDGPDPALRDLVPRDPAIRFAELPTHDWQARWGHWARLAGIDMAKGEIIAYLDDDNAFRPDHLRLLVDALLTSGADFAYSRMLVRGGGEYEVGSPPPAYAQIDTSIIVHRAELLQKATWQQSLPTIDWDLVARWLGVGATWTWVAETTVDYYAS
jgi:glycosyltransferase involved in cell wall biosynthesis